MRGPRPGRRASRDSSIEPHVLMSPPSPPLPFSLSRPWRHGAVRGAATTFPCFVFHLRSFSSMGSSKVRRHKECRRFSFGKREMENGPRSKRGRGCGNWLQNRLRCWLIKRYRDRHLGRIKRRLAAGPRSRKGQRGVGRLREGSGGGPWRGPRRKWTDRSSAPDSVAVMAKLLSPSRGLGRASSGRTPAAR